MKGRSNMDNIKLTKPNLRMCVWICFQRFKLVLDNYRLVLDMDDENNYLDEYLTLKKLNLKRKNYSFNY